MTTRKSFDYMGLCWQSDVSDFSHAVIAFLPRSKLLLILCLQSPSAVILEPKKMKSDTVPNFSPSICHEMMGLDDMIIFSMFHSLSPSSRSSLFRLLFHPIVM